MKAYYLTNSGSVRTEVCNVPSSLKRVEKNPNEFFAHIVREGLIIHPDGEGEVKFWVPPHRILRIDL